MLKSYVFTCLQSYMQGVRFFGTEPCFLQCDLHDSKTVLFSLFVPKKCTETRYFCPQNKYIMKYILSFALLCCLLSGCSVTQKTEVSKFTVDMNVVKTIRPDLYEKYMKGEIVIDDVYLDRTHDLPFHGIEYHAVSFVPSTVK